MRNLQAKKVTCYTRILGITVDKENLTLFQQNYIKRKLSNYLKKLSKPD